MLSDGGETTTGEDGGPPSFEQTGAYVISDPEIVPVDADFYEIVVDAEWVEEGEPVRKGCSYVVYAEGTNEVLINKAFTLLLGTGQESDLSVARVPTEDLEGTQPGGVDVRCQP